jgi:hypothetical protein
MRVTWYCVLLQTHNFSPFVLAVQLLPYLHTPWLVDHGCRTGYQVAWDRMMFTAVWDAVKQDKDALLELLLKSLTK